MAASQARKARGKSKKASKSGTRMCKPRTDSKTRPGASRGCQVRVTTGNHHRTSRGSRTRGNPRTVEAAKPKAQARRRHLEGEIWKTRDSRRLENALEKWRRKSGTGRCVVRVTCEFTSLKRQRRESLAFCLVTLQGVGNAVQVQQDDAGRDGSRREVRGASPTRKAGGSRRRHPKRDQDGRRLNRTRKHIRGAS